MKPTPEMIEAFHKAYDDSLELQPRETPQAIYEGMCAALALVETGEPENMKPTVDWKTSSEVWQRAYHDMHRRAQKAEGALAKLASPLSPAVETGEPVPPFGVNDAIHLRPLRWWLFKRLSSFGWWICPEPHKSMLQEVMPTWDEISLVVEGNAND